MVPKREGLMIASNRTKLVAQLTYIWCCVWPCIGK